MERKTLRLGFFFILCLIIVSPARAQIMPRSPHLPKRPVSLDWSQYSSIEAALHSHSPHDLRDAATVVGRAERVPLALNRSLSLQVLGYNLAGQGVGVPGDYRLQRAPNGTVRWMEGQLGSTNPIRAAGKRALEVHTQEVLEVLEDYSVILGLHEPEVELRPIRVFSDELGYVHTRFEQTYDTLPVWGRDLYVHAEANGAIYAINGTYEQTPREVVTTPALREEVALQTVIDDLKARQRWAPLDENVASWLGFTRPESRLVLYPDGDDGIRLAYEVSLHPNFLEWYTYLIDGQDGRILNRIARHCTIYHDDAPPAPARSVEWQNPLLSLANTNGSFANGSAFDLNGRSQNLRVYQHDDGLFYMFWDLPNLDLAQLQFPDQLIGGALTITANNTDFGENLLLTHVTSTINSWTDPASVSAHINMQVVYDYYKNTHGRNAINGNGQSIISVVHVTEGGLPMGNAFWNGRVMAYGDGNLVFKPLAGALDVAAHEMTHGVIQNTANLLYQFQSGALNESFADVFGVMVDSEDLLIGEDIMLPGFGVALRDLLNPNNPQVRSSQPAHMSDYQILDASQDNGGVHINSGIPNRAAALVIQSIGREKAERIYYRALSTYLTRNSQFGDALNALEQSAQDLYGGAEVEAVRQAFEAVGISSTSGSDSDAGNDLPAQTGGQSLIAFMLGDGTIGYMDATDPNDISAYTFSDSAAVARVDVQGGDRSQLTTTRDGETIWFINKDNKLTFLELSNGEVSVFESLYLFEEGDLRNASISPDENYVALVSTYLDDPTLYIFDGQEISLLELRPETSQDGIEDESIQYPDVVSWSPNPQVPRIAFDAYSKVDLGAFGSTISYWSMYEINFTSGSIFNLVPTQSTYVSIGNITYSNTDPDLIAYNVITDSEWDVLIRNYETGETRALSLPSFSLNSVPITDAQRPTFSPDDRMLCFTTPEHEVVLFYEIETETLSYWDFQVPMYNPRWFVRGGSGGIQNQAPTAQFVASTASGHAPLPVNLDASSSSDPNGDPLTYRWDFGDGSVGGGVTTSHTFTSVGTFTIVLTVTDSGGLSGSTVVQVQVTETGVSAEIQDEVPQTVILHQNYPNPFNPSTAIRFELPDAVEVDLRVIDMMGRTVATLVVGQHQAGTHVVHFDASELPSGVYFARLSAGSIVRTSKMVLLR